MSIQDQEDFRNRFKNLKGLQGENTLSQIESFSNVGFSILDQIILDNTQLNFGLRWDSNTIGTDNSPESIKLNQINPSFQLDIKFLTFKIFGHLFQQVLKPQL